MDLDFNKIIEEKAKEYALAYVHEIVAKELNDYDIDNIYQVAYDVIGEKVDKLVNDDEISIQETVTNAMSKEMMVWVENNMYQSDILACIKEAMVIKFSEMQLEDLIKIAESLEK